MKLLNWFKITYWILLTVVIGYFFVYKKYSLIESGNHLYLFIFLIWTAILLLPLFGEIKFFGIELKKEVEELKGQVNSLKLKLKLNNKNSQETKINVNPAPPSDKSIAESQKRIKRTLEETLKAHGIEKVTASQASTPDTVNFLFNIRYNIEKEIRRLCKNHFSHDRNNVSLMRIITELKVAGVIDQKIYKIIRDVYSITSPAIHGEEDLVSKIQFEYIREVGPELIATLKEL